MNFPEVAILQVIMEEAECIVVVGLEVAIAAVILEVVIAAEDLAVADQMVEALLDKHCKQIGSSEEDVKLQFP
jgi:hypothetical protein